MIEPDRTTRRASGLPHPGDGNAMGRYRERYRLRRVGNFLAMRHRGTRPTAARLEALRPYAYDSNRACSSRRPEQSPDQHDDWPTHYPRPIQQRYGYDAHGNMTAHAAPAADAVGLQGPVAGDRAAGGQRGRATAAETTYYVYDAAGSACAR